ncbi:MAG: YbhB/YbcL family Raf kinase inhibitor-like protein [bacterium]
MKRVSWLVVIWLLLFSWCGPKTGQRPEPGIAGEPAAVEKPKAVLTLVSSAFDQGKEIPKRHTGDGEDVSPELIWDGVPAGTKSFALICSDPDAPLGTFIHWVIYNIPDTVRRLPEGIPGEERFSDGTRQGVNGFRRIGYNGPKPPPGKPHRYFFRLYALDTVFALEEKASAGRLQERMDGHILGYAELMGIYGR